MEEKKKPEAKRRARQLGVPIDKNTTQLELEATEEKVRRRMNPGKKERENKKRSGGGESRIRMRPGKINPKAESIMQHDEKVNG